MAGEFKVPDGVTEREVVQCIEALKGGTPARTSTAAAKDGAVDVKVRGGNQAGAAVPVAFALPQIPAWATALLLNLLQKWLDSQRGVAKPAAGGETPVGGE